MAFGRAELFQNSVPVAMIAKQQNVACKAVAEQAAMNPLWADYSAYCELREQGLRQEAFNRLSRFIGSAAKWSFAEQKKFVLWLCGLMESVHDADYGPFPRPVRDQIFRPFFDAWILEEPANDDALVLKARYLGDHRDYAGAIAVNPDNQRARRALALDCIGDIEYATQHLPPHRPSLPLRANLGLEAAIPLGLGAVESQSII